MTFEAGRPYLISHSQAANIMKDTKVQQRTYKVSLALPRVVNFHIAALKKNQRVLVYNASGGYGDQLLTWPLAKYLHDHGAAVHVLTDPGNNLCWWNQPFVRSVSTLPILWETVKLFDHFLPFESVVNMDEHPDQLHPVDAMFHKIGVDPESIPAAEKSVRPIFTPGELGTLSKYMGKRVGLYQFTAANPVRSLPVNDSIFLIAKLAEALPDIHWLCLYDEYVPEDYRNTLDMEIAKRQLSNVEAYTAPNLRELWALTEHVSVVVCPDSMMAHVAGVFGTPCVGLWGPMSPESRVRYYQNHHPVYHREFCPHSPCFAYSGTFPRYCPSRPATRTVCDVMAGITPAEVIDLVKKVAR
jgi:ADP-heptose:LPS heptosyltransferase